jgi:hypothetical protein
MASEYFHMSHGCTNPSFYAVTRNCTCLKRGEKGVSDPALLDNADGSQAVGRMEVIVVVHSVLVKPHLFYS